MADILVVVPPLIVLYGMTKNRGRKNILFIVCSMYYYGDVLFWHGSDSQFSIYLAMYSAQLRILIFLPAYSCSDTNQFAKMIRRLETALSNLILLVFRDKIVFVPDPEYHNKLLLLSEETSLEACYPNMCQHGGRCVSDDAKKFCQCSGYYTGRCYGNLHLKTGEKIAVFK